MLIILRKKMVGYRVVLIESEEGFAVHCPALNGCVSQGETREEALDNIKIAILEWLEAEKEENISLIS